ncbi:MAG: CDP-diacylglycerol--glycerol-3-phosphate 3-phosphatidyltransferase [Gammaproteobacteria bacterium]|jgi:CDP-diacylglycerol--glycerol-3-phosphate 3-phosphatidyltransferase
MQINVPNALTLVRIALIPVFVVLFYIPGEWAGPLSASVFALASVTDWLDGFLARQLGQSSVLGAFLDPVADKLMVAVALVLIVQHEGSALVAIPAAVIVGREIAVSALREWMSGLGEGKAVAVNFLGKVKTTAQMLAILLLLYRLPVDGLDVKTLGLILLYVAAALTLWSMMEYIRAAWPRLRGAA